MVAVARSRPEALAEAYRRYADGVFGLARRVLRADVLAEDVVQEVFLHLWRHPDRFDPGRGTLRAYLLTLCHRRSVDLIRAETARRAREEREARWEAPLAADRTIEDLAWREDVRGAMHALSAEQRRAIELAYFSGLTYQEVAMMLDEPEGTIKSRIRTGLRRMRNALAGSGIGEP